MICPTRFLTRQPSFNNDVLLIRSELTLAPDADTPPADMSGRGVSSAVIAGAWPVSSLAHPGVPTLETMSCADHLIFNPSWQLLTGIGLSFLGYNGNRCFFRRNRCNVLLHEKTEPGAGINFLALFITYNYFNTVNVKEFIVKKLIGLTFFKTSCSLFSVS